MSSSLTPVELATAKADLRQRIARQRRRINRRVAPVVSTGRRVASACDGSAKWLVLVGAVIGLVAMGRSRSARSGESTPSPMCDLGGRLWTAAKAWWSRDDATSKPSPTDDDS
jgi:hypothetical protein